MVGYATAQQEKRYIVNITFEPAYYCWTVDEEVEVSSLTD